jgi:hypothetical protein
VSGILTGGPFMDGARHSDRQAVFDQDAAFLQGGDLLCTISGIHGTAA